MDKIARTRLLAECLGQLDALATFLDVNQTVYGAKCQTGKQETEILLRTRADLTKLQEDILNDPT